MATSPSVFATDRSPALTRSVSVLLLAAYSGPFASGIFMAPAALAGVGHYLGCVTANRVTPRLAKGVPQPMSATLRALIAFQCLMLAPVVVWARPITELLLGTRYAQSAEVLKALAPFVFFAGLAPLVTRGVDGADVSRRLLIYAGTLAIAVAGGVVLIPRRGVVGGAIATDVAIGFYTLAHLWACRRRFNLRTRAVVWAVASAVTSAGAMGIVLTVVGTKDLTVVDWVRGCLRRARRLRRDADLHARGHHVADSARGIRGDRTTGWARKHRAVGSSRDAGMGFGSRDA